MNVLAVGVSKKKIERCCRRALAFHQKRGDRVTRYAVEGKPVYGEDLICEIKRLLERHRVDRLYVPSDGADARAAISAGRRVPTVLIYPSSKMAGLRPDFFVGGDGFRLLRHLHRP